MTSKGSQDPQEAVARLRSILGDPFVDWVLNEPGGTLSRQQVEVAVALDGVVAAAPVDHPAGALAPFTGFDPSAGTSVLNALRVTCGGVLPAFGEVADDPVRDALQRVALDCLPELLMKPDRYFVSSVHSLNSPHGDAFRAAALTDPLLARFDDGNDLDSRNTSRSTGAGGTTQLAMLDGTLLQAAWSLALLDAARPTFDNLAEKVSVVLSQLRDGIAGQPTSCTGVASLSGLLLPEGAVIETKWGYLRQARESDHPPGHRLDNQTSMSLESGEHVVISDIGDILLVAQVPYRVKFPSMGEDGDWSDNGGQEMLEEQISQVRLAYLLSWANDEPPVLLPIVRRFVDPLTQPGNYSWFDPNQAVGRMPTQLTIDDVTRWQEWIDRLDAIDMERLTVVPSRLLRASAERKDPADALIDTVIVWEALFTERTESGLRVSASIARLLEPSGQRREALERRVNSIYNTRSRLVHGGEPPVRRDLAEASRDALRITLDLICVLVRDRPDLVPLKSSERSRQVLLE